MQTAAAAKQHVFFKDGESKTGILHSKHSTTCSCMTCSCMTRWFAQARRVADPSMVKKDLLHSSLEALVNTNTCGPGKVSGIRELIRGCSQWRHFKLLPCLITQCWCQEAALYLFHSDGLAFYMLFVFFPLLSFFFFFLLVILNRVFQPHVIVICQYKLTLALQHLSLAVVLQQYYAVVFQVSVFLFSISPLWHRTKPQAFLFSWQAYQEL